MSWSLGEVRSLVTKAARGAGFHWGLAEEAGFAVQWLQAHGAPGTRALLELLKWLDQSGNTLSPIWKFDSGEKVTGNYNPIELGVALMDKGQIPYRKSVTIRQPLLLVPFIASIAPAGGLKLNWNDVSLHLGNDCFQSSVASDALLTKQATCHFCEATEPLVPSIDCTRVPAEEGDAIIRLTKFAARTYAPATEESRLAGAGAGLTDND